MTPAETLLAFLTRWPPQACVESAAREVIAENARLRDALNGLIGLTELIVARRDLDPDVATYLITNHRAVEARKVAAEIERGLHARPRQ